MKFVGIEKKEQGKFITRYDVQYETVDGIVKNYEMISRNGEITDFEGLHGKAADAVVDAAVQGKFLSKDDFRDRTKVSKTVIDLMDKLGLFGDIPQSNQISLFDFSKNAG